MPERRTLILTSTHLSACTWRNGQVRHEQEFSLDDQGHADFREWLQQGPRNALYHLLADLPDEAFQQETLPYVSGKDRQAMLSRKVTQLFFDTPYTLIRSLGREKQGRRDENILFAALTRPQAIEPWITVMHEVGAAVAGIHSPALLLGPLLDKQQASETRLILLTLGAGGLRQSYFEYGQLRFSRLKPLTGGGVDEAIMNTYGEAVRIYQYLIGQRIISRGTRIPVLCLADLSHQPKLRQACANTDELSFDFLDLAQIARAKHLRSSTTDLLMDDLLVHLLCSQRTSPQQFGDAAARIDYTRWLWRTAINIGALAAIALASVFTIAACISITLSQMRRTEAESAAEFSQVRYNNLVQSMPTIAISPEQLRTLITQWRALDSRSPDLATSLAPLSKAMQENPRIELQSLDWRLAANPDDNTSQASSDAWLVIDIEAQLPPAIGMDRRIQSESVDRFVASLKQTPDDNARILQRPFDTDSSKPLRGSNEAYAGREPLNFSVRYWRKVGP